MYTMKLKGTKNVMREELERKMDDIVNACLFHRELIRSLKWVLLDKLDTCETYEDLETFCVEYYRMSLTEWVESL